MKFYIVTPTYNSLAWLERCLRSVADQAETGVEVHHHVQDGGSTDGTAELLADWQQKHAGAVGYTFTFESTKDAGMYDALNKAWEKMPAEAEVTAHLNSDEQYLPHALRGVAAEFARRRGASVAVLTDSEKSPIASLADAVLTAKSEMVSFVDSLVAPMSVINAIIAYIGKKRPEIADKFRILEDVWNEYKVYSK
jgi:glycosyltransferase involved in cell wall biosynthesis